MTEEGTVAEKDEGKTERYEMPKRIDRLEKHVAALGKQQRELQDNLAEAFKLLENQSRGLFGIGSLAGAFEALAKGFKRD